MKQMGWAVLICVVLIAAAATTAFAAQEVQVGSAVPNIAKAASEKPGVYIWNNAGQAGRFAVVVSGGDSAPAEETEIMVWPMGHWSDSYVYTPQRSGARLLAEIDIRNHGSRVGTYCVGVFRRTADDKRQVLGSERTFIPPQPGTLSAKAADTKQTEFCLELKDANVLDDSVIFFTISRDGQKTVTKIAHKDGDGFAARVPAASLGSSGTYDVQALCTVPGTARPVPVGGASFAVDGVRGGSTWLALAENGQGVFSVRATADEPSAVQQVYAEVRLSGTDSVRTYPMHGQDGTWTAAGSLDDFSHTSGTYSVRVYAELENGLRDMVGNAAAELRPANYMWTEKDKDGVTIHVDNTDPSIGSAAVPVWSVADGQDDVVVYEAQRSGENNWQARMEFRRHMDAGQYACSLVSGSDSVGTIFFDVLETDVRQKEPMRGVWVPSVWNLDFPRKLNDAQAQMNEFRKIVQNSRDWGFNALFVQVRPHADAMYQSEINPWSDLLTGHWGKDPGYDPLEFMVQTAHDAGLELHAWLNPYRVCSVKQYSQLDPKSAAVQHPDWLLRYKGSYYLDPGHPGVRQHLVDTVHEIIDNYDVDGIHFDDYFYPYDYPVPAGETAAQLRENVNMMVRLVSEEVRSWPQDILFGISPFGIWKNGESDPAGSDTLGLESYYSNYCDTVQWVREGIVDYICPQLYWHRGHHAADYTTLVNWWTNVTKGSGVDLYIGQGVYEKLVAAEIQDQLILNAQYEEIAGSIFYRYGDIEKNPDLARRIRDWYDSNPDH